jgi:hypothetical protein
MRTALIALLAFSAWGQLTTGILEGTARPGAAVIVTGSPGRRIRTHADAHGRFRLPVPYGEYRVETGGRTTVVYVGVAQIKPAQAGLPLVLFSSVTNALLAVPPAVVTEPLDFSGLGSMRLPLVSARAYSWTETRLGWQGLDASDSYQPGLPVVFPDIRAISDFVVREEAPEVVLFRRQAGERWHGALATADTGAGLAWGNLNAAAVEGGVLTPQRFRWFTNDHAETGGPLGDRADLFFSGTAQWASQTVERAPAQDLGSRLLFGNANGRVRVGRAGQIDGGFSGSRIDLDNWGMPAGLEALIGRRLSPELWSPDGFAGLAETDHLDLVSVGWTQPSAHGALEVRYGYSTAHLDTTPASLNGQSRIDFTAGVVNGAPPLANRAKRARHDFEAAWTRFLARQRITAGGGWQIAHAANRFTAPGNSNLVLAAGAPVYVVALNTPVDSREAIRDAQLYVEDRVSVTGWLTADAGIAADFPRGSVVGQPAAIAWNSAAPRAGVAISPPFFRRLVVRGSFARYYLPLAGQYLDFSGAGLGGSIYRTAAGGAPGPLLVARFGGPVSSIDRALRRPYADEIDVGTQAALPAHATAAVRLFRRDMKDRIAAVNTGLGESAFHPVSILDPGPDGIPGTFDDQVLTVYAQDPATFGADHYLLTNPARLRMSNQGVETEIGIRRGPATAHASFMAVRSRGPTNPGDSPFENDPGVIGALYADPNTLINASGRDYFDRAFVGKVQLLVRLPRWLGGIEWSNVANYLDGLVFARQLLVTGLPQGPFLVAATVRGSPEGGNRAEYVINWNTRIGRSMALRFGTLELGAEIFNVTNANNRLRESDASGPLFNQRLPLEIEAARFVRIDAEFRF